MKHFFAASLISLVAISTGFGQYFNANHPELKWHTFETEHFIVHFHDGADRTAYTIAKIAEEIYPKLTSLYDYKPDTKFHFIVKDTDDYANGAAYYYNNKMLIWCTALDFDLRGTTNWLRNVITHEYTHVIQLGSARKAPRFMPAIYLQALDYEYEKRPDVLYGYPNLLVNYPVAMTTMPMWFAEGTAQFNSPDLEYDYWDSHRDMQLRIRALHDDLLPLHEMEVFGKTSLGNEGVYNAGFNLVRYINNNFGSQALADITHRMKKLYRYDFNKAVNDVLGFDGKALYEGWKNELVETYDRKTADIQAHPQTGTQVSREGYINLYPLWNAAGDTLYYSSNRGKDYYGQRSIYRQAIDQEEPEIVLQNISSPFDLSSDGRWLVYSQVVRQKNESFYADLFLRDLKEEKSYRLTRSARALEPSFSPDGSLLTFVLNADGTKNVAWMELPELDELEDLEPLPVDSIHTLTDYNDGTQVWRPRFHPDGERIYFARGRDLGRDVVLMEPYKGEIILAGGPGDQRDPVISSDGKWLYYSSDETGIFNLYRQNLTTGGREALTNVLGGAFMPAPGKGGKLAYSEYTVNGYRVKSFDTAPDPVDPEAMVYDTTFISRLPRVTYDDSSVPRYDTKPYKFMFENLFIVPRIGWDYGRFKPGAYFFSSDFLEKSFMFAGFSINSLKEMDLFSRLEFKVLRPTLFLEGYYLKRVADKRFEDRFKIRDEIEKPDGTIEPVFDTYGVDYTFSLFEVDAGATYKLSTPLDMEVRGVVSRYDAKQVIDRTQVFKYTYFKGKYLQVRFDYSLMESSLRGNIHPKKGLRGQFTTALENNQFIKGFRYDADKYMIVEDFQRYQYMRYETDLTGWFNPIGEWVLQPRIRAGYLDHDIDSFMYIYAGGLHGMRGYTYFSMGGSRRFIGSLTLRHPLIKASHPKFAWFHFDGLYAGVFGDFGDAWGNKDINRQKRDLSWDNMKTDVGVELRAKFYSWYGFPTAITFTAARGLNTFSVLENSEITTYRPDWKYYLTVLFDFETIFPVSNF